MLDLNQLELPSDVRDKLAELELELSEGDITQKGYDKKRTKLLAPFINLNDNLLNKKNENKSSEINHHVSRQISTEHHRNQLNYHNNQLNNYIGGNVYGQAGTNNSTPHHHLQQNHHHNLQLNSNIISSPQTRAKRKQRRVTRHESRYHSEVRKEAVQQAIAAMKHKPKSALPMPSKRNSNLSNRNKDQRNKCNLRSNKSQLPTQRNLLQRGQSTNHHSSGHGTTGDTDEYESTDDDYDDEDDLIDLRNETSSSDTQELNVQNRMTNLKLTHQQHQQLNSSSEEQEACSSTASSSTNERNLILSKHHISSAAPSRNKQQQPLPPKVIGVQESANKYVKRYESSKNYNHLKPTSNQSQQTQLFQLKENNNHRNKHSSSASKNLITNYSNSPPTNNNNLISNEDNPPALPQHQTKINYNQQKNKFDERPPERTPVRKNSRQQTTVNLIDNETATATDDLISFEPASIDSFNNEQRHQNLNTMLSSGSNNSSSNNNTSLSTGGGLIDEFSSLNNQNCSSIDNLPPEYDQVYQSSNDPQQLLQDNQGNRSPSNRSRLSNDTSYSTGTGRYKVSAKIQQLLNTLKRPKKRPLDDFYKDDDFDQQASIDPNAPKPEGHTMTPIVGEQLTVPSGLPKTLEEALQRYGSATFKASAVTVLDTNGKISPALTYGKLWSRSKKIAYNLLNKVGQKRSNLNDAMPLKAGDRIALVFPNNDPINFICAFYGCLCAGIVPVSVEVPITRRDSDSLQIGFLLGSCKINYAITSEACFKGLPKTQAGEVHTFKGWPKLNWLIPDNWNKPPKDWLPPTRISEESVAYIEYTMDREGSIKGVAIPRTAMIKHCKALTNACLYTEGDIMVCTENFKREVGLYHSVLTSVLNGIHVVFIPYSLMKISPSTWLQMITKYKATTAICKSRDLHWGLLSSKEAKDINLSSLRMLLVADGSNPWSLSSIDSFATSFNSKGLKCESLCTNASSTEAMTVAIRRPGRVGIGATGRGVLSMNDLSYNVIRVDTENSLTSLTLQDCGHILPGTQAAIVKINGNTRCKTDEVGEICISGFANECFYEGLHGLSENHFKMEILNNDGSVYGDQKYVRSGLLGFTGPGGLVFVCGTRDGLIQCSGRKHNSDDLIATVLAVEPMKFVYRGRIAIFSIKVLKDQRICVIAEQRPDCTEEQSFQWMSKVLQAIDSIHHVGIYCLALVQPNHLPRTPLGGIHMPEIKRKFLEGKLNPINILMCPHSCITNLPAPRETPNEISAASRIVGCLVQGNKLASAEGRELGPANDDPSILLGDKDEFSISNRCQYINEILKWRASTSPDHNLFTLINSRGVEQSTLTCMQLHKRAERIANLLVEKGKVNSGDHVALVFQPGIELICSFYACLYVGAVPISVKPPSATNLANTLPTVKMIVDVSKSTIILSNSPIIKFLKTKEAVAIVELKNWPTILDIEDATKKRFNALYKAPTSEMIAYLDFSISSTGLLAGVKISHSATTSLCKSMKLACELYPSRHIALCLEPYSGLGFVLWCLSSIWSGHHSILIPQHEVESNPTIWLTTLSQYKVRDTFCSYAIMELCTKEASIQQLKSRNIDLTCVRTCIVVSEERPRVALTNSFTKLFSSLGLSNRAVSTSFGCRVNVAMCLQGASSRDLETVYIDQRALRNDRVTLVEKGAPHSLCLIESGKLLPGVSVIIANPDTKGHLGECNLGEIWVKSAFNSSGYVCVGDEEANFHNNEKFFAAKLSTGDTSATYARTGYLGFIRKSESTQADNSEEHDEIYVVGSLDETIMLRGMRYHPIDIENSVLRCHKKIGECAIFTWTNLLVVVAELNGNENEALDLVPLITNVVLEDHQIIVGVVVIVDPNTIERNSSEKQRVILRDRFLQDKLNPIYVAYNM